MNGSKILAMALLLFCAPIVHSHEPISTNLRTVEHFIAAFNAQDASAMGTFVTSDVAWLSINGMDLEVETRGKNELIASMDAYFKFCPTCRSLLSEAISTPDRVSAVEVASWEGQTGSRSQRALSVYEFSAGLIHRVYYFPAEK